MDTIFALSSGAPPAAIAIVRISGPAAEGALKALCGGLPESRVAVVRTLVDPRDRQILDRALVVWMPGPGTATGEDTAELHLHGGRALIGAVEAALAALPGLRRAEPGEFTRRAFANGKIDLAEAEGLADLIEAETELQRRNAQALASGKLSRAVESWREELLRISALQETRLDFSDEDDVTIEAREIVEACSRLAASVECWTSQPPVERLKDGFRVVLAGPPNAGKSTLFNALVEEEASIISPTAGTTRDIVERTVAIEGIAVRLGDTAGLNELSADPIERIGMQRAQNAVAEADLTLWLGDRADAPPDAVTVEAKGDLRSDVVSPGAIRVSALSGEGVKGLKQVILDAAKKTLPKPGQIGLHVRQRELLATTAMALRAVSSEGDELIRAEHLRQARLAIDRLVGRAGIEDLFDAVFGRFCIGK